MNKMVVKLAMICLLCVTIVAGGVLVVKYFF
jgi:hypothetical protein